MESLTVREKQKTKKHKYPIFMRISFPTLLHLLLVLFSYAAGQGPRLPALEQQHQQTVGNPGLHRFPSSLFFSAAVAIPAGRKAGEQGGTMEAAPLSHASKKALTSSLEWVTPADYHRDTVGSSPCHTGAEICPHSLGKQAALGLVNCTTALQTNKHTLLRAH